MTSASIILTCVLASSDADRGGWEETNEPFPPPCASVLERAHSELSIRDGRLYRRRDGEEHTLGGLALDPPGEIVALAADPAGLTFVAAENGLFVVSPEVDVLDRVDVSEGAPRGPPTSVVVDARRRVWIATPSGFGPIDPGFFWGRTVTIEAPGPYRVAPSARGGLLVHAGQRTFRYDPDHGATPAVSALALDGEAVEHGDVVTLGYGTRFELVARGSAAGDASFRYRIDGHHVWRELTRETRIGTPSPGRHTLEVVAVDRDLNRSRPVAITLDVPYPWYYAKRFVAGALAGAALVVFAAFLLGGRTVGRLAPGRALLSTALVLILALQLLAGLVPHARGWPFVGFSMYTRRFDEGQHVYEDELSGVLADGSTRRIPPRWLGAVVDDPWQVLRAVIDGGERAAHDAAARWVERVPDAPLAALQVRSKRTRLTANGPVAVAPLVLVHVPLTRADVIEAQGAGGREALEDE